MAAQGAGECSRDGRGAPFRHRCEALGSPLCGGIAGFLKSFGRQQSAESREGTLNGQRGIANPRASATRQHDSVPTGRVARHGIAIALLRAFQRPQVLLLDILLSPSGTLEEEHRTDFSSFSLKGVCCEKRQAKGSGWLLCLGCRRTQRESPRAAGFDSRLDPRVRRGVFR